MECPQCETENPEESHFCKGCGFRFHEDTQACPLCGYLSPANAKFGLECGGSLMQAETPTGEQVKDNS